MTDRLTKTDWLNHGLTTLANEGIGAVKADRMAKAMGVSRGSFYWHFRDIRDFLGQLLQHWQGRTTDRIIEKHPVAANAAVQLRGLIRRGFSSDQRLDHAVRTWAADDADVAALVAAVDARRVQHIAQLMEAGGLAAATAAARANFIYWALLGKMLVADPALARLSWEAIDDIGRLFAGSDGPAETAS